jgi:hypothetical protein
MIYLLATIACSGGGSKDSTADKSVDTAPGYSPVLPEQYKDIWDDKAASCDGEAIVYHWFQGEIDERGRIDGKEGYYWFFGDDNFDGDCVDTFTLSGPAGDVNWQQDPCSGCDRAFTPTLDLPKEGSTCNLNYPSFFDDSKNKTNTFQTVLKLDPLSPGGNLNEKTLVMMFVEVTGSNSYTSYTDYARGDYTPATDDFSGPAHMEWVGSSGCVKISH